MLHRFMLAALVVLAALAMMAAPASAGDVTYHPLVTNSLDAASRFAGLHYFPETRAWPPTAPGCPLRNGRPFGLSVEVVSYIGPPGAGSAYGGYAPPGTCTIQIGIGSWNQAVRAERRYWGLWLRRTTFCPLIVHEAAHHYLRDGSHNHTPDLNNSDARYWCGNIGRVRGWNRAYHPPRRHG